MSDKKPAAPDAEALRKAKSLRNWAEVMQAPNSSLLNKMSRVLFEIDLMKGVEDALSSRIADSESDAERDKWSKFLDHYTLGHFASLVKEVADQTGADPAQIADKNTRTPEQQRALQEAYAHRELDRMASFFVSDYLKVESTLREVDSLFDKPTDPDVIGAKESFILLYFATRPDIRPREAGQFTQADKEALIAQYKRFESFIIKHFGSVEQTNAAQGDEWITVLEAFITQENPDKAEEAIERLSSVLPKKSVMPINKLANVITEGIVGIGEVTLDVSRRNAKKPIETTCILTYEGENVKLSGRQAFTEYDRNVYNAVASLYVYGDQSHVITPEMVYRAMNGLTNTENPSESAIKKVTNSLDKMRFIRARINCTAELKARRVTLDSRQINNGEIDTYLLAADAIKVRAGGQTVNAYRILKAPILYEYSAAVNQILTVPSSLLDIKEIDKRGAITTRSLPNTESRIRIRGYLLRRIEGMKGKNALRSRNIALCDYEKDGVAHRGLYTISGNQNPDGKEKQRIREDVERMLAFWVAVGYIKAYKQQTQGRKITGYTIEP